MRLLTVRVLAAVGVTSAIAWSATDAGGWLITVFVCVGLLWSARRDTG